MLYFILSSFMGHNNFPIMYGLAAPKGPIGAQGPAGTTGAAGATGRESPPLVRTPGIPQLPCSCPHVFFLITHPWQEA